MTTFDELFAEHNLTPNERKALVMHLATLRAQKTVEALQDCPLASAPSTPPPAVVEAVPLTIRQKEDALQEFTDWFVRNYPGPDTIISDPKWHAPKVFRQVLWAIERGIAPKAAQPVEGER